MRHFTVVVILGLAVVGCGGPDAAKTKTATGSTPSGDGGKAKAAQDAATQKAKAVQDASSVEMKIDKEIALVLGGGVKLELVLIPAGKFMMGSPADEKDRMENEGPQHEVTLTQPFYMGKYEVTQAQYEKVMGANPSNFKGADLPVETVSWDDAQAFCKKVSELTKKTAKLPTEAQWEYACRAGTTTEYNTGPGEASLEKAAWFGANSGGKTNPAGKKLPNAWGLYDMHGNVWEWCEDYWWKYAGPAGDPQGPATGWARVFRSSSLESGPRSCRSAWRDGNHPSARSLFIGFRLVVLAGPK